MEALARPVVAAAEQHLDNHTRTNRQRRDQATDGRARAFTEMNRREATTVAVETQRLGRGHLARQELRLQHAAATQIGRVGRGYIVRQDQKQEQRRRAATLMEAVGRGHIVRQEQRHRKAAIGLAKTFSSTSGSKTTGAKFQEWRNQQSLHTQITGHLERAAAATNHSERESALTQASAAGQKWLDKRSTLFGRISHPFEGARHKAVRDLVGSLSEKQQKRTRK